MVLSRLLREFLRAARRTAPAALVALAGLLPAPVRAVAPPPPDALASLGARCESADHVRVETRSSSRFLRHVRLEADAVVLPGVRRAALIEVGTPPEKRDTRIPWADVERVSIGRDRTAQGFLLGGLVGATAGGAIVGTFGSDLAERGDNAVLAFAVVIGVGCTVLGTLLGAGSPAWTPLYP